MNSGRFYFLKDKYFTDFPDKNLMQNKEFINGEEHNRPCYYSFQELNSGIYWMIPVSTQTGKYKKYYDKNISKYGKSDTIIFGNILNKSNAFLVQNMFPIIDYYIRNEYRISDKVVKLELDLEKELLEKSRFVLSLVRRGTKLVFPDILKIEKELISMLNK